LKVALVGAGTIIFQDEGIGVYAADYIAKNYTFQDEITIVDGGTLGFILMTYYQEYDKVVILDTITMNDEVGSVYNLPAEELLGLGSYKQTAHEVEIVEMLEICSFLDKMADVNLIGIVPKDILQVNIGLTDAMKERFATFIAAALDELAKVGIRFKKNEKEIGLESIIYDYANPSMKTKNDNNTTRDTFQ
jgi:hydrogenase maturation protease